MKQRFEKWRRLPLWEQLLLARLVVLLPMIGLGLQLIGYKRTRDVLGRLAIAFPVCGTKTSNCDMHPETAHRIAHLVTVAALYGFYRATCLRQSLALWWLLKRCGILAELRFGVRRESHGLDAHAWVELHGTALNDAQGITSRFTILNSSSPSSFVRKL